MTYVLLGIAALSLVVNGVLVVMLRNTASTSNILISSARARALEVERQATARIDSLLNRINTSERIYVEPAEPEIPALSSERPYISDFEYDQDRWEDHVNARQEGKLT